MEVRPFNFQEHPRTAIDVHEFLSTNFACRSMTSQKIWEQNCCERRQASGKYAGHDRYQDECEEER
jgi:hypothetical protein